MEDPVMVVAGSYEQVVFGYEVSPGEEEWTVKPIFTHHAHTASLSSVAASKQFIATGSKDETIQLYDMTKKTEHGALLHHEGSVSCLEFYGTSHLISSGEDGLLCVWSTKTWECLKTIKAHKGHVTSLSVHPSGKLALSVGTDKKLRTWNLIDGRSAFCMNIKENAHLVRWSPEGDKYVVAVHDRLDIYCLESARVISTLTYRKRISSVKFLKNTLLAVAGDDENVQVYDLVSEKCICDFKAHETRVKAVESLLIGELCVIITASNDGFIKLWKLIMEKPEVCLLGQVNSTARLTCLSVWRPNTGKEPADGKTVQPEPTQSTTEEPLLSPTSKRVRIAPDEVILEEDDTSKKRIRKKKNKVE